MEFSITLLRTAFLWNAWKWLLLHGFYSCILSTDFRQVLVTVFLDSTVFDPEIYIDNYEILRFDKSARRRCCLLH